VNINIQFSDEQAALLKTAKVRTGVPIAETIRRAVRCWLDPYSCALPFETPSQKRMSKRDE
jgi:hypothetical protein